MADFLKEFIINAVYLGSCLGCGLILGKLIRLRLIDKIPTKNIVDDVKYACLACWLFVMAVFVDANFGV